MGFGDDARLIQGTAVTPGASKPLVYHTCMTRAFPLQVYLTFKGRDGLRTTSSLNPTNDLFMTLPHTLLYRSKRYKMAPRMLAVHQETGLTSPRQLRHVLPQRFPPR